MLQVVETLAAMAMPRDAFRALRKAVLQHSAEHNVGLMLKEHGHISQAQPLVCARLARSRRTSGMVRGASSLESA